MQKEDIWNEGRVYTIRDLLLLIGEYLRELRRKWYVFALLLVLVGAWFTYKVVSTIPEYTARVTFMVQGDEGNALGGAASILSQFGLGMGRTNYNLNKIQALISADKILIHAALGKDTIKGREDFLANHIIDIYEFDEEWEEKDKEDLVGFRFSSDTVKGNNILENKALNSVIGQIKGNDKIQGMLTSDFDDLSGILELSISSRSASLSISLATRIFYELQQFYSKNSLEGQRRTFEIVQSKRDSLFAELQGVERALAKFQDQSQGYFLYETRLAQLQLERERQKLTAMYGEAVKNMEIAEFTLKNSSPALQLVDTPFPPLKPKAFGFKKAIVLTLLFAAFIGTVIIVLWKIIRDALHPK